MNGSVKENEITDNKEQKIIKKVMPESNKTYPLRSQTWIDSVPGSDMEAGTPRTPRTSTTKGKYFIYIKFQENHFIDLNLWKRELNFLLSHFCLLRF